MSEARGFDCAVHWGLRMIDCALPAALSIRPGSTAVQHCVFDAPCRPSTRLCTRQQDARPGSGPGPATARSQESRGLSAGAGVTEGGPKRGRGRGGSGSGDGDAEEGESEGEVKPSGGPKSFFEGLLGGGEIPAFLLPPARASSIAASFPCGNRWAGLDWAGPGRCRHLELRGCTAACTACTECVAVLGCPRHSHKKGS